MFLNIDLVDKERLAAIDDSGQSVTYGDLCDFVREFGGLIPSRSLIFILSENTAGAICGYAGALANHIVPLIISSHTDKQLYEQIYSVYQPEYLWLPQKEAEHKELKILFSRYGFSLVRTSYGWKKLYFDLSLLLPTSGSTGSVKLVRHSYRNIEANAQNVASLFGLTEKERAIVILPLHYTMGLSVVSSHLSVGATLLVVQSSMTDAAFWKFMREENATSFTGVPFSFEILRRLRFFDMDFPSLSLITQGGGKMDDVLFQMCADYAARTGKRFIATYGQTEGTARMAYLPAALAQQKTGSIGIAIPNGRLSIRDDDGNVIETREAEGEMVYEGENVTLGYALGLEDLQKGDENCGILNTNDIVRRDSDGCFYVIGRKVRFLKLFGLRVGLDECEQLIRNEYQIECACAGDDKQMKIYVTDSRYCSLLPDYLARKTGIVSTAFSVKIIERLPKNEAGKILYSNLK
jgi:acyl-coenzyme A synthetase/AMP-(fatty) acid ligase